VQDTTKWSPAPDNFMRIQSGTRNHTPSNNQQSLFKYSPPFLCSTLVGTGM